MKKLTLKQKKLRYYAWVELYSAICEQLEDTDSWTSVIPLWKHIVQYTESTQQYSVHYVSIATLRLMSAIDQPDYKVLYKPILNVLKHLSDVDDRFIVYYTTPL